MVGLATAMAERLGEGEKEQGLLQLLDSWQLLILAKDQDWETKLFSVDYWRAASKRTCSRAAWRTALVMGCGDYEGSVRSAFRPLLGKHTQVKKDAKHKGGKRTNESDCEVAAKIGRSEEITDQNDRDEYIEDILDEADNNLVKDVLKRSGNSKKATTNCDWKNMVPLISEEEFSVWHLEGQGTESETSPSAQEKLLAVLEDIIHSKGETNMIDMVDCY